MGTMNSEDVSVLHNHVAYTINLFCLSFEGSMGWLRVKWEVISVLEEF